MANEKLLTRDEAEVLKHNAFLPKRWNTNHRAAATIEAMSADLRKLLVISRHFEFERDRNMAREIRSRWQDTGWLETES